MTQRLLLFVLGFFVAAAEAGTHTPISFNATFFTRTNQSGGRVETRWFNSQYGPDDGRRLFTGVRLVPTGNAGEWLGIEHSKIIRVRADGRATNEFSATINLSDWPMSLAYDPDQRRVLLVSLSGVGAFYQRTTNGVWSTLTSANNRDFAAIAYRPKDDLIWSLEVNNGATNQATFYYRYSPSGAEQQPWIAPPPPENISPTGLHAEMVPTEDGSIMVLLEKPYTSELTALDHSRMILLHPDFGWYVPAYDKGPAAPPAISFERPTDNASVNLGQAFDIQLFYQDPNDDIVRVELFGDGMMLKTWNFDPSPIGLYAANFSWAPTTATNHILTAVVTDFKGATGSAVVQVWVKPGTNANPGVQLSSPRSGQSFPYGVSINLQAFATNVNGAVTLSYYTGTNLIGSRSGTTGTGFFSMPMSWSNPSPGSHTLRAVVENAGFRATSAPVQITVARQPMNPTIHFIAPPATNSIANVGEPVNVVLEFWDLNNDITTVDLFDGNLRLRRWTFSPSPSGFTRVEFSWIPATAGSHTLRAVVYDSRQGSGEATANVTVRMAADLVVERELPVSYTTGIPIEVVLRATPNSVVGAWAIEEQLPAGWTIAKPREGTFDPITKRLKWGPFTDTLARQLSYALMPPTNSTATAVFYGIGSADGVSKPITGDVELAFRSPFHPADMTPKDSKLTVNEVTAYAAAWKRGLSWETGPTNIPISYVTRAGFLWKSGEQYRFVPSLQAPDCWAPLIVATNALAAESGESVADRVLPPAFTPGRPVNVTVRIRPAAGVGNYAVQEEPPADWTISNAGEATIARGSLRFGPFYDSRERSFTYTVVPPLNALGGAFRGWASFDGTRERIGGQSALRHSYGVAERNDRRIRLRFNATPGERFEVETADSLGAKEWTTIGALEGAEAPVDFDTIEPTGAERYYRLRPVNE